MKEWALFLLSVGGIFVMISSTMTQGSDLLVLGLVMIVIAAYLLFRRKKG